MPESSPAVPLSAGVSVEVSPPAGGPFTAVYVANQSPLYLPMEINGTQATPQQSGNAQAYSAPGGTDRDPAEIKGLILQPVLYPNQSAPAAGVPSAAILTWYTARERPPGPATLPVSFSTVGGTVSGTVDVGNVVSVTQTGAGSNFHVNVDNFPAAFAVSNFPATQTVSGTVTVAQPSGAALHVDVDTTAAPAPSSAAPYAAQVSVHVVGQLPNSGALTRGAWLRADPTNTAAIFLGPAGVTVGTGLALAAGDPPVFLPVANVDQLYAVAASAQTLTILGV